MLTAFFAIALTSAAPAATAPASSTNVVQSQHQVNPNSAVNIISDTEIIIEGVTYKSWAEVAQSGYYHQGGTHCGTDPLILAAIGDLQEPAGTPSDCSFSRTRIMPEYEPSVEKYRIPVVVHIIERTNGTGAISDARVHSQIEILNEDFQAFAGTNGAPGNDAQIEFYLAEFDPSGNPTTAITRSVNNTWYNDGGSYWNSLAWDTNRYLNIYTNSASGALGYVPNLPQGGIAGSNSDRVVILHSTFGRNAPFNPFHLGRTVTHEVGHFLGLEHTFAGGCSNSYTSGDLIMDTNPESSPTSGCPSSRTSCGSAAPFHNYMDYSNDICMNQFTPEQNNRMRCSLLNYRPDLYELTAGPCSPADLVQPYGSLNFLDVSSFLVQFGNEDSAADLNNDGSHNFLDVSQYLAIYGAGCP
jgi:pregnancy-associated plasma protein-A